MIFPNSRAESNQDTIINLNSDSYILNPLLIDERRSTYRWQDHVSEPWCSGSGVDYDPYVIQNVVIDANGSTFALKVIASDFYFIIRDCVFYNVGVNNYGSSAIILENSQNGQIFNNNCSTNDGNGIFIYANSDNNLLSDNVIIGNKDSLFRVHSGIKIIESNNLQISNSYIRNYFDGFSGTRCYNLTLDNNTIMQNFNGVSFKNCNSSEILKNAISSNRYGLDFEDCSELRIINNEVNSNSWGIVLNHSIYNEIYSNSVNYNEKGIGIANASSFNLIKYNILVGNGECIIEGSDCEGNFYESNYCGEVIPGFPIVLFDIIIISTIIGLILKSSKKRHSRNL